MSDSKQIRTKCVDKTWGWIRQNPDYYKTLFTDPVVLDPETFQPADKSGSYTIDLNLGLCVPGHYNAETGEITIEDEAVVFDPWE